MILSCSGAEAAVKVEVQMAAGVVGSVKEVEGDEAVRVGV